VDVQVSGRVVWAVVGRCALIVAALVALYALLPFYGDRWWIGTIVGLVAIAALVPLTFRRVRSVLKSDRPVVEAIEALVVLLVMLVLGFSATYLTLDRAGGQFHGLDSRVDAVYFTVVTLGTVGFGDITATGQLARVVVVVQIAFDFLLIALAARLLVGAARRRVGERG
jgi:voltage-gated potassium channel